MDSRKKLKYKKMSSTSMSLVSVVGRSDMIVFLEQEF